MTDDVLGPPIILFGPTCILFTCGHSWRGMEPMPSGCPVCDKTIDGVCTEAGSVRTLEAPKAKGKKGERP